MVFLPGDNGGNVWWFLCLAVAVPIASCDGFLWPVVWILIGLWVVAVLVGC